MNRSLAAAGLAGLALACTKPDPIGARRHEIALQHQTEAEAALLHRDYARAALAAHGAADADPFDPAMRDLVLRVRLTAIARSPESAIVERLPDLDYAAEMLLRRDPAHKADYLVARGQLALAGGDVEVAERFVREALALPEGSAAAQLALARLSLRQGKAEAAVAACEAALTLEPGSPQALRQLGEAQLAAGKTQQAAKSLADAVSQLPKDAAVHRLHGLALFSLRQVPEAAEELQRAVALEPGSAENQRAFGDLLLATGQLERAQQAYENAARAGAAPAASLGLAQIALRQHDDARAAAFFAGAARELPGNLDASFQAAMAFDRAGRRDDAVAWLQRYVQASAAVPAEQQRVAEASRRLTELVARHK